MWSGSVQPKTFWITLWPTLPTPSAELIGWSQGHRKTPDLSFAPGGVVLTTKSPTQET